MFILSGAFLVANNTFRLARTLRFARCIDYCVCRWIDRIHTASGTVSEAQANSVKMAVTLEKDLNMRRRRGKGGPIADDGSAEEGLSSVEVAPAGFHTEMMDGMRSMREAIKQLQDQMREMHAQMGKR